jgi:hypothetical protein
LTVPGVTLILGVGRPEPVIVTVSAGVSGSFELMVMLELYGLTAAGINLMVITQDAAGFRETPEQVLAEMLKGAAGAVTEDMARGAVPVFVTLISRVLVVPISLPPKSSGEGETRMFGTTEPVPERFTGSEGLTGSFEFIVKTED